MIVSLSYKEDFLNKKRAQSTFLIKKNRGAYGLHDKLIEYYFKVSACALPKPAFDA